MKVKYLIAALVPALLFLPSVAVVMAATNGKVQRSQSEQIGNPPTAAMTYDRDCDGNGKPRNLATTSTPAVSGTVTTTTISETDGVNTWTTTSTYDSSSGAVTYTCAQLQ